MSTLYLKSDTYYGVHPNGNVEMPSTIRWDGTSYIVTRPDGTTIKCHNRQTARWYVANPTAK